MAAVNAHDTSSFPDLFMECVLTSKMMGGFGENAIAVRIRRRGVEIQSMAFFKAKNLSDKPVTGTATFNVTPAAAGKYFTKIQCFCFTQQTLQPGEEVRMPVIFYVDPAMLSDPDAKDIQEITLSYTFYPVDSGKAAS